MSETVKLTIDDKKVTARAGQTILDAALEAGIHIPNFCYIKGMKGIGACRMCLVEIEGMKSPMTACTMRVKDGMVVRTENERIREIRRYVTDLILSMHPLDCMTCTKAGVCELQKYAYELEVRESSFTRKKFGFPVDDKNPFIKRDPDYCILCARCVRVCKEQGTSVLDFSGRGVGSKVTTAGDRPLHESGCTFCGSCIDACPVNAILEADRWRKGREWDYERVHSVCTFCGNACDTVVSTYKGEVAKVNIGAGEGRADHYICAYGRYGFDYINADTRVVEPLENIDGEFRPVSWKSALSGLAERLSNPEDVGIVLSGNLTNEDYLTVKNFAHKAGIKNLDSTVSIYADERSLLGHEVDLNEADLFVVVGLNPSQWERVLPALDATIRKKQARGAKLIVIHPEEIRLSKVANVFMKAEETEGLSSMINALSEMDVEITEEVHRGNAEVTEDAKKAAELFNAASNPVIVTSPVLYEAALNLGLIKGKVLSVPVEANARGALMMGAKGEGKSYKEMIEGGVKVLVAIGDVPGVRAEDTDYLIVFASHMTDLAEEADLVLPITTSFETEGTVVDYQGRLKTLERAIEPFGNSLPLREAFGRLSKTMGLDTKVARTADVKRVLKGFEIKPQAGDLKRRAELEFSPELLIPELNAKMIKGSRLSWLEMIEAQELPKVA